MGHATLDDADLSGANLTHAYLGSANLSVADLSGADLSFANLARADLEEADLSGADLTEANLSDVVDWSTVTLEGVRGCDTATEPRPLSPAC